VRGRASAKKKLGVALAALVGGLLLIEGAVRLRQYLRYGTTSPTFYDFVLHEPSGLQIPVPGDEIGPIEIDSLGFRSPELEVPKPPGRIRVAFLGGSTTFCAEASALETTWPHLVVEELRRRHPETSFDYVNGGAAGYSTRQSLPNLEHRIAPLEPDLIVVYHATNDLTQDSRILAAERGLYDLESAEEGGLGELFLTWHLVSKNLRWRERSSADGAARLECEPAELSQHFRARLGELVERTDALAGLTALVTFSHRARREQGPEERRAACGSSLYYMPFMGVDALLDCFEEYNRVIREVARERGAVLVEGEHDIPADGEHFNDSVHFLDPGCALQAERVVRALEASPAFAELLGSREEPGTEEPGTQEEANR